MFSFGIFTTHLPYIAMVVFYAYFLIFGLGNNLADEESFEANLKIEIEKENYHNQVSAENNYYFQKDFNVLRTAVFKDILKTQISIFPMHSPVIFNQGDICYSRFSRPPPKA